MEGFDITEATGKHVAMKSQKKTTFRFMICESKRYCPNRFRRSEWRTLLCGKSIKTTINCNKGVKDIHTAQECQSSHKTLFLSNNLTHFTLKEPLLADVELYNMASHKSLSSSAVTPALQ